MLGVFQPTPVLTLTVFKRCLPLKFIVFQIFSGSKEALSHNTGGVETFLNNMLENNSVSELSSIVIGRQSLIIPQVITTFNRDKTDNLPYKKVPFPYIAYFISNLIFGFCLSFFFLIQNYIQNKVNQQIVLHVHDPIIGSTLFLFYPKFLKSAICVTHFHSEYGKRLKIMLPKSLLSMLTLKLYSGFEKICFARSQSIIAVSGHIQNYLIEAGCSNEKISKIPIFLNISSNKPSLSNKNREAIGLKKDLFILTYIGRLTKEKNVPILLSAFFSLEPSMRQNMILLIVGAGDQLNNLKRRVPYELLDKVQFLGHRSDVNLLLDMTDIFVLPSLTEGFPFSLLEAMAHGKTIIASNIAPIAEVVKHAEDAFLFNPRKCIELKNVISKLYLDPILRKNLGKNARKKAEQYDKDIVIPKIIHNYEISLKTMNLLNERSR